MPSFSFSGLDRMAASELVKKVTSFLEENNKQGSSFYINKSNR